MKKLISGLVFLCLVAGIVLYAAGVFSGERVEPNEAVPATASLAPPTETVVIEPATVPVFEDAVGTVESRTTVSVSAQVTARVKQVHAEAGGTVTKGTTIIELDDAELAAARAQAQEAVDQAKAARELAVQAKARAEAVLTQAKKAYDRVKGLFDAKAATPEQLEVAEAMWLQSEAGVAEAQAAISVAAARVQQAAEALKGAEVAFGHATIEAPLTGVVAMKNVETGDLALPGKVLLEVLDPQKLRLVAQVREGLVGSVRRGEELEVVLPALDLPRPVTGTVSEVCPTADPTTRTFRVRVDIEALSGLRPGMFGRLRIPRGDREVVRLPASAISRTGQLATVVVESEGRWERRMVTLGHRLDDDHVEILSGLGAGERVGLGGSE